MNRQEMLESLSEDILTYVMHGSFPEDKIAAEIKPAELDERFEDYRKLMDLHFILKPEVVEFVEQLPNHLREVKTQTKTVSQKNIGAVEGRINWSETLKTRYTQNPGNNALFICDNRSEHYNIDENIVLKKLLSIIYSTLKDCEKYLEKDYEWINQDWKDEQDLVEQMKNIFERNVHVRRIKEPEEYEPTQRMLNTAETSRQEIYRKSSELIKTRQRIQNGNEDELRRLLDETAITPDDDETLFELFVLFKFIGTLEDLQEENFRMKTITSGKQEVARMESETKEIRLYHDTSVDEPELKFRSDVYDKNINDLSRSEMIQRKAHETVQDYFVDEDSENHTGRPDILVLEISDQETGRLDYLVTEVKNSTTKKTIRQGIKETLEYLAFLTVNDHHLNPEEQMFGTGWNGLLVHQDLEDKKTQELKDQRNIKILQASELENKLEKVVGKLVAD